MTTESKIMTIGCSKITLKYKYTITFLNVNVQSSFACSSFLANMMGIYAT